MRFKVVIMMLAFLCFSLPGACLAKGENVDLWNLEGVYVSVEVYPEDIAGLTASGIKADIEKRLREAGIKVLTAKDRKGKPCLDLDLVLSKLADYGQMKNFYQYSLNLELREMVKLERKTNTPLDVFGTYATTWKTSSRIAACAASFFKEDMGPIRQSVNEFIRDYKAANPD
jgi:hypothetical protein